MCYSANFAKNWTGEPMEANPPDSAYGMVFQEIQICDIE